MFIDFWQVVVYLAVAVVGFAIYKLWCRLDSRIEDRRKKAFVLGMEFAKRGAKRLAKIFTNYGAGDYSGVIEEVKRIADNIADGVPVLDMEFKAIAKSYVDEQLTTVEGRAVLAKALADATPVVATPTLTVSA